MIVTRDAHAVEFLVVRRRPGTPTVAYPIRVAIADVKRDEIHADAEHSVLLAWVRHLDLDGRNESERREALELATVADFPSERPAVAAKGDGFRLRSDAPEELVRRLAVRLDQFLLGLTRYFPPQREVASQVEIMFFIDPADAGAFLKWPAGKALPPAVYEPRRHKIVAGSDLARLGDDLGRVRRQDRETLAELQVQEKQLRKLFAGRAELQRHLEPIFEMRRRIARTEARNDAVYEAAAARMTQVIQHELFHAYWSARVFSPRPPIGSDGWSGDVPRWLNEGLAMVAERGFVEAGELRLGRCDADRLVRLRSSLSRHKKPFLTEWLRERHATGSAGMTEQCDFDLAWGLAHQTMFGLDGWKNGLPRAIACSVREGTSCEHAFEAWLGMSPAKWEPKFRDYVEHLKPDGTRE